MQKRDNEFKRWRCALFLHEVRICADRFCSFFTHLMRFFALRACSSFIKALPSESSSHLSPTPCAQDPASTDQIHYLSKATKGRVVDSRLFACWRLDLLTLRNPQAIVSIHWQGESKKGRCYEASTAERLPAALTHWFRTQGANPISNRANSFCRQFMSSRQRKRQRGPKYLHKANNLQSAPRHLVRTLENFNIPFFRWLS